ncbi:MAG: polyphosphate polymerase domain-containing protein [Clostridia bacterium]|nr:polyphosphate polymerase domain-containing protein [Clostridia bacterium]
MGNIMTFNRTEKKYFMTEDTYRRFLAAISPFIEAGDFPRSRIQNLYFDTPDFYYIRNSIDAVNYKEKVRLRCYGDASPDSTVFLEIKKKCNGIVYKRRETMKLREAEFYIRTGLMPKATQIMKEIDYTVKQREETAPAVYISYDRDSYRAKEDHDIRITFDSNILARVNDLDLKSGIYGNRVIPENTRLLEIKVSDHMPIWLAKALSLYRIYPASFSKYGKAYRDGLWKYYTDKKGVEKNVINF